MSRNLVLLSVLLAVWTYGGSLVAQGTSKETCGTAKDVTSLAEKTLDGIRDKDITLLGAIADPAGIYIGIDSPLMSTAQFKKELAHKTGVYCTIFESCAQDGLKKSPAAPSLREQLMAQPTAISVSRVEGLPRLRDVVVERRTNPNEIVFTLVFQCARNHWTLVQIEYY